MGLSVRVLEQGDGVGGTWYWNRYPGVRCDIESLDYSYSFSEELEQEWDWTERYPTAARNPRYLNHVADRFDLRRDIQLNTRVTRRRYDEARGAGQITTDGRGRLLRALLRDGVGLPVGGQPAAASRPRGLRAATGTTPRAGRRTASSSRQARRHHRHRLDRNPADPADRAEQAQHLYVFQRTAELQHAGAQRAARPRSSAHDQGRYARAAPAAAESLSGVPRSHPDAAAASALEVTAQERAARCYERGWAEGGHRRRPAGVQRHQRQRARPTQTAADFVRSKIRQIVSDPAVAEALCPTTHPIGTKRICVDIGYYATYNRDNVTLVDVRSDPIDRRSPRAGSRPTSAEYELDVLVFATGFDAITGALLDIDIRGRDGLTLRDNGQTGRAPTSGSPRPASRTCSSSPGPAARRF